MTSLVDEAVFDYFSVLLADVDETGTNETDIKESNGAKEVSVVNKTELVTADSSHDADSLHHVPQAKPVLSKVEPKKPAPLVAAKARLAQVEPLLDKQALEQLLAPVFKTSVKTQVETPIKTKAQVKVETSVQDKVQAKVQTESQPQEQSSIDIQAEVEQEVAATPPKVTKDLLETLDDDFQVLFFKVAGLTLAVPLVSLGGIVQLERVNHIMGRPSWYKGVQTHRDSQLNIVDTCAWVMPEKYDKSLAETVNYQYVVLLEDSNWGLTCESLVNSVKINKSAVNWRTNAGKRPWLAGVVREQMCGILHVHALIELLNAGLGSQDPVG